MTTLQSHTWPDDLPFTSQQLTRVIDEYELQTASAGAQYAKSVYCYRIISDLYHLNLITSRQTMEWMVALDHTVEFDGHYGEMWRQYSMTHMGDYLDTMLKADRLATRRIAEEIDRSLYLPLPPPKQPGLLVRLLEALAGNSHER